MKPFNLEAAKNGAKVVTRGGNSVRLFCFDYKNDDFPIAGAIDDGDGEETETWCKDGFCYSSNSVSHCDLFMAPTKKSGWINIYRNDVSEIYDNEKEAKEGSAEEFVIDTLFIEWEE